MNRPAVNPKSTVRPALDGAQLSQGNPKSKACSPSEQLQRFLQADLTGEEMEAVAAHVDACETCRRLVESDNDDATRQDDDLRRANELREQTHLQVNVPLARLSEALPDYEIVREIGRGGMGIVFEARHVKLGRRVALKVLPALLGAVRPDAVARFRREAELAAGLEHTNIIGVYDFGDVDGTFYYTMPLIDGRSLRDVLAEIEESGAINVVLEASSGSGSGSKATSVSATEEGARTGNDSQSESRMATSSSLKPQASSLPLTRLGSSSATDKTYYRRVAGWMADVAEALEYAHEQGVIHRDIKPSNLLLAANGRLMISDFGLAKAASAESLTVSRALLGTARYMSPEQANESGNGLDRRVDVYGLGATLYELLAFRPVFSAADDREVLDCVLNKEPAPPRRFVRQVPRELETICLKALEKDRKQRYATTKDLSDDLRRWLLDMPICAKRPSPPARAVKFVRRRKLPVTLGALAAVALIVAGSLWSGYHRSQREAEQTRAVATSQEVQLTVLSARSLLYDGQFAAALEQIGAGLKRAPDHLELQRLRAKTLRHMGKEDEAIALLEDLVARHPDYWDGHYSLAIAYGSDGGDKRKAAYHRKRARELRPDSAYAFYLEAEEQDDPRRAIELLSIAIALEPIRTEFVVARGKRYHQIGDLEAMLLDAEHAVTMRNKWSITHSLRGRALLYLGRFAEAEDAFNTAIELDPTLYPSFWVNRALAKNGMSRFAEAIADATEAIRLEPQFSEAYQCRARSRAGLGDVDEALADYAEAIRLKPTNVNIYLDRSVLYAQAGRWEDIVDDSSRVIQLRPEDHRGYQNRAYAFMRTSQVEREIGDLAQYIRLRPDDAEGWRSRGEALTRAGRFAEAIEDYGQALELESQAKDLRARAALRFRLARYDDAIVDLTQATDLEPTRTDAWMYRGMAHELTGAVDAALSDYQQAATRPGPTSSYARLWQHVLLRAQGQQETAQALLASVTAPTSADVWTGHLFDLFAEHMASNDLLAAAATDDERAEAYYYVGRKALLDGNADAARTAFEQCVDLDREGVLETDFARALLTQLNDGDTRTDDKP